MTRPLILLGLLLSLGCSSTAQLTEAQRTPAFYGPYPENYSEIVEGYFQAILKDPYSAKYRFGDVYQGYLREAPVAGGDPTTFGYIVEVWVNAKNGFGGYTGEKFYRIMIRDGQALGGITPNPWFSERWYK